MILPIAEYEHLLEMIEDVEDVRLFDEAKRDSEVPIPKKQAMEMIEAERNKTNQWHTN